MEVKIEATNTAALGALCGRGCMQRNISSHTLPPHTCALKTHFVHKDSSIACASHCVSFNSIVYRPYCQVVHVIWCCYAVRLSYFKTLKLASGV